MREAIVQVLAEFAFADQHRQIPVSRSNDAHVDLVSVVGTQRADFAFLQHAQQLGLQGQRHVADFIEQQGAAIGRIEQTGAVTISTGERAFAVAEQFTFQQVLRERRAVLHDERLGTARPAIVNRPGNDFLASAGFTAQQHGVWAVQDFADQRIGLAHGRTFADQAVAADARNADRARQHFSNWPAQTLQQMQLAQHERTELPERIGKAVQVDVPVTGAQQQTFNGLLLINQRHAQQRLPWRGLVRQERGFVQAAAQFTEADHAVLAQGELQ